MEVRSCPECGRDVYGRLDKKFCSDSCRNKYNNKINADKANLIRRINSALRKNRRVLEELNPSGKTKTHKEILLNNGFDFQYFTHTYTTRQGAYYRFCYDQGYLMLEKDYVLIVRREEGHQT